MKDSVQKIKIKMLAVGIIAILHKIDAQRLWVWLLFPMFLIENFYVIPKCASTKSSGLADNEKAFKDKQFFKCQMPAKTGHSYQSQLYY